MSVIWGSFKRACNSCRIRWMKKPIPCCTSSCLTLEPALGGSDEPARACLTNLLNGCLSSDGHRKQKKKQEGHTHLHFCQKHRAAHMTQDQLSSGTCVENETKSGAP